VDQLVDFETACTAYGAAGLCFKGNLDPVSDFLQISPAAVPDETLRAFCAAPSEAAAS
jgi:hypothetical protein